MKKMTPALFLWLLAGTSAALAQTPAPTQACLRQNMVLGWKVVNDQTLVVSDRVNRQFTVTLEKGCHDLKWPSHLGFSNGTGFGIGCIGARDLLYVPANGGFPSQRCIISDVQPYGAPAAH
jgi:hypothetical protein